MDVTREESIAEASKKFKEDHGKSLRLLLNCAGILSPTGRGETGLS